MVIHLLTQSIQQGPSRRPPPHYRSRNPPRSIPGSLDLERDFHRLQIQELPNDRDGLLVDPNDHRSHSDVEDRQEIARCRRPVRLLSRGMLRGVPGTGTSNAHDEHRRIHKAYHGFWIGIPRLLCWKYW